MNTENVPGFFSMPIDKATAEAFKKSIDQEEDDLPGSTHQYHPIELKLSGWHARALHSGLEEWIRKIDETLLNDGHDRYLTSVDRLDLMRLRMIYKLIDDRIIATRTAR